MNNFDTIKTAPLVYDKSVRPDQPTVLTSGYGGKILPLYYAPLHRHDRVSRSVMSFNFEMTETAELLMNPINVTLHAWLVPNTALDRFEDINQFNKAYAGVPEREGESPKAFPARIPYNAADPFWATLGIHHGQTEINGDVLEAYNQICNYRYRARSSRITERTLHDASLAPCFWKSAMTGHIVPDFDQAAIEGEVPLTVASSIIPVKGLGMPDPSTATSGTLARRESGAEDTSYSSWFGGSSAAIEEDPNNPGYPLVFAEMEANGITVSLANLELAKQTAAFAEMRQKYRGIDEDHVIDLLMQGLRVPEEEQSQPILLARESTIFGYSRRYATDGSNLNKHVANGETNIQLAVGTPEIPTGGVVMVTAEIVPEQLYERQKDYYLSALNRNDLPNNQADFLDPEKVSIVQNDHLDVAHADADGTFGYAPLNHQWRRHPVNIGGKYRREAGDPFDEDRQKVWTNETTDPELTEDFFLATTLHHKVFAEDTEDPFEITAQGQLNIIGLTQFGKGLHESAGDYDKVLEVVETDRIDVPE